MEKEHTVQLPAHWRGGMGVDMLSNGMGALHSEKWIRADNKLGMQRMPGSLRGTASWDHQVHKILQWCCVPLDALA